MGEIEPLTFFRGDVDPKPVTRAISPAFGVVVATSIGCTELEYSNGFFTLIKAIS